MMKSQIGIPLILTFLLMILICSCSEEEFDRKIALRGEWEASQILDVYKNGEYSISFRKDYDIQFDEDNCGEKTVDDFTTEITWIYQENEVDSLSVLLISTSISGASFLVTNEVHNIQFIDEREFILTRDDKVEVEDGTLRRYYRTSVIKK